MTNENDQIQPLPADWGEDGSDLHSPVRAHIESALVPTSAPYPPPLDRLLLLGNPDENDAEAQRAELGIGQEHVADLVRMARDRELQTAEMETTAVWAPLHALQALQNLDITLVAADLVPLIDIEDDWYDTLLPELFAQVGPNAFEPLRTYIQDQTRWIYGRATASNALVKLAQSHPAMREQVVAVLSDVIDNPQTDETINGLLISDLVKLEATEALPEIRRAFERDAIDESISGGWGDVQKAFGLQPDPADPLVIETQRRRKERHEAMIPPALRDRMLGTPTPRSQAETSSGAGATVTKSKPGAQARKKKNKRKQQAASRKANKRK